MAKFKIGNIKGPQGPQGPKGDKGDTVYNGKPAYEYAVEGGYTGSEEEFKIKLAEECPPPIVNSVGGTEISVSDASNKRFMGMRQYGRSRQQTTTGKNLFDPQHILKASGWTVDQDGVYTGPADGIHNAFNMGYPGTFDLQEKIYTLSFEGLHNDENKRGVVLGFLYSDGTRDYIGINSASNKRYTLTSKNKKIQHLMLSYDNGVMGTKIKNIQLECSDSPTSYEPYTGGKPSPSPEYPQPIVSAGDKGSIETDVAVGGRNLLGKTTNQEIVLDESDLYDGSYYEGQRYKSIYILNESEYILSFDAKSTSNGDTVRCYFYAPNSIDRVETNTGYVSDRDDGEARIELTTEWKRYWIKYTQDTTDTKPKNIIICRRLINECIGHVSIKAVKVEKGHVNTPWTSAPEDNGWPLTYSAPNGLPGIPVDSGGNYTDETGQQWISDEIDWGRGVYVKRVKDHVFDGSMDEGWYLITVRNNRATISIGEVIPNDFKNKIGICNMFQYNKNVFYDTTSDEIGYIFFENNLYIRFGSQSDINSVDKLRAWLGENNLNILLPLVTPTETPIPQSELAAYRALHTKYLNTTIYNDEDVYTEAEYVADTETYINQNYVPKATYTALEQRVAALEAKAVNDI